MSFVAPFDTKHSQDKSSSAASKLTNTTDIGLIRARWHRCLTCYRLLVWCKLHRDPCRSPAHCLGARNSHHRPYLHRCMSKKGAGVGATV